MPKTMTVEDDAMGKAPPEGRSASGSAIPDELVDQLLEGYSKPEDLLGPGGLIKQLGKLIWARNRRITSDTSEVRSRRRRLRSAGRVNSAMVGDGRWQLYLILDKVLKRGA